MSTIVYPRLQGVELAISALSVVNALLPKDWGSRRVARGLPYGAHERNRLDIYAPRARQTQPLPVVVWIYGGAWSDGDRGNYSFAGRALAAQGFLTLVPDYRLVPDIEYPVFLDDTASAISWALEHAAEWGGDASRLATAGHSSGAYNAVMAALAPDYGLGGRIKAVAGLAGPYDFFPFDVEASQRAFREAPDPLLTQPVNIVTASAPPMYLATGDSDKTVYPRNTVALSRRLRELGVEVTERHFPKVGHAGILLALGVPLRGRAPVLSEMSAFFHDKFGPT